MTNSIIRFFLENKLIALLLFLAFTGWGLSVAPFDWDIDFLPRNPVPVDAIPDIGDNQQIVFTEWPGRSPQDIEDQITYPLTTQLLGLPGVRTVRSNSMFGFSSINIIFEEDVEFYWSRSRILEKLSSLPGGTLPDGVEPTLGPDATALGQIFWYTLEGYDADGNPTGGWDPHELRSIQDFQVRLAFSGVQGVAEVASIGGYVKEYQVDIDPIAMRVSGLNVNQIADAVRKSNLDVGARTIEMNSAEYIVRGLGFIQSVEDLEESVVTTVENTPIRIKDVARVSLGSAQRQGALDKAGADATGGVIVARFGENPLEVINRVKEEIEMISPGLPSKELADGTHSQLRIVPFYDRSGLIYETLGTLEHSISLQVLITIIVIIIMVMHLRTSVVISALMPLAVLMSFIMMKYAGVDANVVSLAGIAISIGVVIDMGIILTENMLRHMKESPQDDLLEVIYRAAVEVSPAVITAMTTTIVSFLPVFMLESQEGRLFGPLAFTKAFILLATLIIVLTLLPAFAHWLFAQKVEERKPLLFWNSLLVAGGVAVLIFVTAWAGFVLIALGLNNIAAGYRESYKPWSSWVNNGIILLAVTWLLAANWLPLGAQNPVSMSLVFVMLVVGLVFGFFWVFLKYYEHLLVRVLENKKTFLALPLLIILLGVLSWRGFDTTFRFMADGFDKLGVGIENTVFWSSLDERFPGLGQEFMPTLNEGTFLLMPTAMPHAGMGESLQMARELDMRISSIPEVEMVTGKIGRAESALDPAPVSMFENIINYKSEYKTDDRGRRARYQYENGDYQRDSRGDLIPDSRGRYYRQWRDHIQHEDDIWSEIIQAADLPGITSAPKLQPIETRLVMLQTGMRGNMGIRVSGPDLQTIDEFASGLEHLIREVEGVRPASVFADRVVGKPYLEIDINRPEIARHGLTIDDVQSVISTAIGGETLGMTVEGRERYPIRVRYAREYRNTPEQMERILVPASGGSQIPLGQLADIRFETGPMDIFSENTFLSAYVIFDRQAGEAPVDVVNKVQEHLDERIRDGTFTVPNGISYLFEGEFRNQQRASERLALILPITLGIIFLLIYFQFRSSTVTFIILIEIILTWAGGFILLWLYGQDWFLNFNLAGLDFRTFFQVGTVNLSVAVWVGFLALFGITVDDGIVMSTYLEQQFSKKNPKSRKSLYKTVIEGAKRRIRPCLMTTGTTILALLPILTVVGKGSEIMIPMAIPIFGGMVVQVLSLFLVPLLYAMWKEYHLKLENKLEIR